MPPLLIIVRALVVRILFAVHGIATVWILTIVTNNNTYWYITFSIAGLTLETIVTVYKKRGHDWKWFCPSVMFYLLCVVPAIWFLELHEVDRRWKMHSNNSLSMTNESPGDNELSAIFSRIGRNIHLNITIQEISEMKWSGQWVKALEQILLLILIIGRWMLPKGKLSHNQLSQLLLVYIGTASDIVELFEAFNEDGVNRNKILCIVILSIWSLSLIQFTMVLTATKARKDKAGLIPNRPLSSDEYGYGKQQPNQQQKYTCCTADVYGVIISIFMQDIPFLILRLLLIFKYNVVSYTNMFFTCKNTLVCSLLVYRVIVVQIERRRQAVQRFRHWASLYHASRGGSDATSSSVVRLVTMAKSASSIASSATAVLRKSQSSNRPQSSSEANFESDKPVSQISDENLDSLNRTKKSLIEKKNLKRDDNSQIIHYLIKRHHDDGEESTRNEY